MKCLKSIEVTVKFESPPDNTMRQYLEEANPEKIGFLEEFKMTASRIGKSIQFGFCGDPENHFFEYDKTILTEKLIYLDTDQYQYADIDLTKDFVRSIDKIDFIDFDDAVLDRFHIQEFITIKFIFFDGYEYYLNNYVIDEYNERYKKGEVDL